MNEQREEMHELEPLVLQHKDIKKKMKKSTKIVLTITALVLISLVVLFVVKKILPAIERNQNMKVYKQEGYIEQDVMKYLEERYGEEFVIESIRGRSYAYDYINMYAYPMEHQEESYQFKIQGRYNEKGILEYTDSYVMLKLRDEYEAYIDPIIDEYFDEYKFYMDFDSEWITSNIPADAKLEDLWELDANVDYPLPWLTLYLPNEEKKNYTRDYYYQLALCLQEKQYRGVFKIRLYYNNTYYAKRNRKNIYEDIGAKDKDVDGTMLIIYSDEIKE